jgi:predicted NBD/HSP70 family sugar kinase
MLALVREGRVTTRAELVAETGLARSTVAQRVDALLRRGYLGAAEVAGSSGGRPPTMLSLNRGFGCVLAADFGATRAHLALCDLEADLLAEQSHEIAAGERGPEEIIAWLAERLGELREAAGEAAGELLAVGVGIPAPVDIATGRPVSPPLMPGWNDHPVAAELAAAVGAPVRLDNDVNVMALGEHRLNWPETADLVFVKVATGIGCGIIAGGEVYQGAAGAAGDLGHVRAPGGGDVLCRCGRRGCLEAIAAGPALAAKLTAQGFGATGASDAAAAIRIGDPRALTLAREAGGEIGEVLATVVNFFNPAAIVFGGEIPDASEDLLAGVREAIYGRSLALATRDLEIVHSAGGRRAGTIGAAVMAIDHVLEPAAVDADLERALRVG